MNDYRDIAARALAFCAGHDPWFPQPNRATVEAWAGQIARRELGLEDVLAGVAKMYADHGDGFRPLPKDLIEASIAIRRERTERESRAEREAREDRRDAELEANQRRMAELIGGARVFGKSIDA